MELIERPNLNAVKYLYSISYDDFKNNTACNNDFFPISSFNLCANIGIFSIVIYYNNK